MAAAVLCNGIGARLELLQPFVDAVDPRREVVRFDMPGIGGSPDPVMPYHLWTLAPLLSGLLDQLGYQQGQEAVVVAGNQSARRIMRLRHDYDAGRKRSVRCQAQEPVARCGTAG